MSSLLLCWQWKIAIRCSTVTLSGEGVNSKPKQEWREWTSTGTNQKQHIPGPMVGIKTSVTVFKIITTIINTQG